MPDFFGPRMRWRLSQDQHPVRRGLGVNRRWYALLEVLHGVHAAIEDAALDWSGAVVLRGGGSNGRSPQDDPGGVRVASPGDEARSPIVGRRSRTSRTFISGRPFIPPPPLDPDQSQEGSPSVRAPQYRSLKSPPDGSPRFQSRTTRASRWPPGASRPVASEALSSPIWVRRRPVFRRDPKRDGAGGSRRSYLSPGRCSAGGRSPRRSPRRGGRTFPSGGIAPIHPDGAPAA